MDNFGNKIRELRKKAGISQKDFAARIGITPPNLSQWESMALPPLEGIMKSCRALDVPLWEFFRGETVIAGEPVPPWIKPEHVEFLKALAGLPDEVQKQLLEHFTGIITTRKIIQP